MVAIRVTRIIRESIKQVLEQLVSVKRQNFHLMLSLRKILPHNPKEIFRTEMKNQVKLGSNKKTSSFEQLSADIGKILILE